MKNTKILVVIPRFGENSYGYVFPLGLGYISSVLKKQGYNVDCLNLNHYKESIKELISKTLDKKRHDFVCTGNKTIGYSVTEKIIQATKEHKSKPKFILGGQIITSEPKIVFEALKPDYGVIGEGEETIIELLECIEKRRKLEKVKGIVFEKNGKTIFTEQREPVRDIGAIPYPDFEGFEFEKLLDNMHCNDYFFTHVFDEPRVYPILGSRGCPFNCTFCYHYARYRKRSVDDIMKELNIMVRRYKINIIDLYDECFAVDKERLYEFCRKIKKLKEELPWDLKWTMQLTVQNIDKDVLGTIKDAGCDTVSYGFESYSKEVLKSMRKPITPEQIDKAFHETIKTGIGIQANFIFGDRAETKETAETTLEWWKKNAKGQVGLGFIQPYPGSEIYEHCVKKGIIKDKANFIKNEITLDHWYNMTDSMGDEEVKKLKKKILDAVATHCKFIRPIKIEKIKENIYLVKVKCPFCRKINEYKNCFIMHKWSYGFYMICRHCHMRFFIVSLIQKIAYKYYSKIRALRDFQVKMTEWIKKKRL